MEFLRIDSNASALWSTHGPSNMAIKIRKMNETRGKRVSSVRIMKNEDTAWETYIRRERLSALSLYWRSNSNCVLTKHYMFEKNGKNPSHRITNFKQNSSWWQFSIFTVTVTMHAIRTQHCSCLVNLVNISNTVLKYLINSA